MFEGIFKKPVPLLKEEDIRELRELERKAYLEEAKKLVNERGVNKAKTDYSVVKKESWA